MASQCRSDKKRQAVPEAITVRAMIHWPSNTMSVDAEVKDEIMYSYIFAAVFRYSTRTLLCTG